MDCVGRFSIARNSRAGVIDVHDVGRTRGKNGKVVVFEGVPGPADQVSAMAAWHEMTLTHPATLAAGACVIVGPTTTSYCDLRTKTMIRSPTPDGAWQPAALSDTAVAEV